MKELSSGLLVPNTFEQQRYLPAVMEQKSVVLKAKSAPPNNSAFSTNPYLNSWANKYLLACKAQEEAYISSPWVKFAVDTIVNCCTMDQYSIETEDDNLRFIMERFLYNIAPRSSFDRLLRGIYRDLMINGNWYGRVYYKGRVPIGLERINFKQIVPHAPAEGSALITSYDIYGNGLVARPIKQLQAREVLHFTLNDLGDNGTGLSNLECLDLTIAMEKYSQIYQLGFFTNGVKAGDVYATDGLMSSETYERDKMTLEEYVRMEKSYSPIFLMGAWKIINRGQELRKDADFLNLRNWNREEILSVFGIPYSLASTDKVGTLGSNGKQEDRESFLNFQIAPLQKQVFEDFNRQFLVGILGNENVRLLPPGRPRVRLDDVQAAVAMTKAGFTGNEIRSALNLAQIKGLDEPLWFMSSAAIIGIPGDPNSTYLTRMGPIAGAPTAVPETTDNSSDPDDALAPYGTLKEQVITNPTYQKLKQQAGNQPTANTLSQSNDSYPQTPQGGKQTITTNPAASRNGNIPDNRAANNTSGAKPGTPGVKNNADNPPKKKVLNRPRPKGRMKDKIEP